MQKTTYLDFVKSNHDRRILCIDMNSYFASVEQQANPKYRNRPIIVTGEGKRTIVIAASKEAKVYGIKTGTRIFEAEKLCPHVTRVYGHGEMYAAVQKTLLTVFERYFSCIEIASIDEVYIAANNRTSWDSLEAIAKKIKTDIIDEIGECVTCSIGISTSKLMAKYASNMQKPDGLTVLSRERLENLLPSLAVTELSGIGRKLGPRLHALGIYTLQDVRQYPFPLLKKYFGQHLSLFLLKAAYGAEDAPVHDYREKELPKSFSHEVTLSIDLTSQKKLEDTLYSLIQRCIHRMDLSDMKAKSIGVHIRYADFSSEYGHKGGKIYENDPYIFYLKAKDIFYAIWNKQKSIRQIGIHLHDVMQSTELSVELFPDRHALLFTTMQEINAKFGEKTIAPLSTFHSSHLDRKIHGFYKAF